MEPTTIFSEVRLPKKKERKKGKLDGIRRLPLHISLQSAIQDAVRSLIKIILVFVICIFNITCIGKCFKEG